MYKTIFFPEKKLKKNVCAYPTYNFQICYPKHTYFLFGLTSLNRGFDHYITYSEIQYKILLFTYWVNYHLQFFFFSKLTFSKILSGKSDCQRV